MDSASRPVRLSEESEEESTRRWWEWTRPAAEPALDEPQLESITGFDFMDEPTSDLPPELDWAALPRWMRAVSEQGPPEEEQCEAGSGPDACE